VVDLFPEACDGCGASLPDTPDLDPRRYQMIDLVAFRRHITEFRRHEVQCDCGHRTRAAYDPERIPASPFGPRLMVVVAMLTGAYHLSRQQTKQLLHELLGIEMSVGAVSAIEARMSECLVSAVEEVQREVENASVKYTDGTSWLEAGVTLSLWTLASAAVTLYKILKDGRSKTIRPLFGALKGILVSDRATVFGFWVMAFRQICWSHLTRRFISFSERDGPAGALGHELVGYTELMFEYWHGFKDGRLTREELEAWMKPLQRQFEQTLERAVAANIKRLSGSCADILAHKDALWTFVTHEGVEPTNNDAERALRPFVLWRKKSYGAQSERGHRFAERIMTVVHTARKQSKNVLDFLVRCVTAQRDGATPPSLLAAAAA
jgi:transposase